MSRNSIRSHLSKCKGIQSGQAFQNLKHWMVAREVNIASEQDLSGSKWPEWPGLSIAGVHTSENGSGTWRHGRFARDAILHVHQEFVVVSMTCIDSRLSDAIRSFISCSFSVFLVNSWYTMPLTLLLAFTLANATIYELRLVTDYFILLGYVPEVHLLLWFFKLNLRSRPTSLIPCIAVSLRSTMPIAKSKVSRMTMNMRSPSPSSSSSTDVSDVIFETDTEIWRHQTV